MSEPEQTELIARAKAGSADAFAALVGLHQDRLYRFLLSRCHARADAEDAMQEAFINAFRYLDSYNSRWEFSTWLYRIGLRELGKLRARNEPLTEPPAPATDKDEDPLAACIAANQRENLWLTARAALGEQAFTAMWLRYAEDMPVKDVARVMGRPAVWVRVTVHRARRQLAHFMIKQDHEFSGAALDADAEITHETQASKTRAEKLRNPARAASLRKQVQ